MKRTKSVGELAVALMADPIGRHWGYELTKQSGLRSGVLYPILHRMLDAGWLEDGWEDPPSGAGKRTRPPRRYYELTDVGREQLGALARSARLSNPAPTSTARFAL
jgi:PadR family transcriptional regulator PadR